MRRFDILTTFVLTLVLIISAGGCGGDGENEDSDGDGWYDDQEQMAGTDPNNVDTDGDGYWDPQDANPLDSSIPLKTTAPTATPPSGATLTSTPIPSPITNGGEAVGYLINQVQIGGQQLVPLPLGTNTVPILGQEATVFVKCKPPEFPTELDYIRVIISWPDGEEGVDWLITTEDWEDIFGPVYLEQEGIYDLTVIVLQENSDPFNEFFTYRLNVIDSTPPTQSKD